MSWFTRLMPPKIQKVFGRKKEIPEHFWSKCPGCGEMIFYKDCQRNMFVCPSCHYHMRISAKKRLEYIFDQSPSYMMIDYPNVVQDPLKFKDQKRYIDRLREAQNSLDLKDSLLFAHGYLGGMPTVVGAQDFSFIGGSLGMAAGTAFVMAAAYAVEHKTPFVLFTAAGGARMQEGIMSLMQMPRTIVMIQKLKRNRLPYIVVLTDPTMGGVTASYAMLGDVHLAEPGAAIGFAGRRVIEQTIREKLPTHFQTSEHLLKHGMIDRVVHRTYLRSEIITILGILHHGNNHKDDMA